MFLEFNHFIAGAIVLGCWAIALFFVRFLRQTRDPLFACFSIAFFLFGIERLLYILTADEMRPYVYFLRLIAFIAIVVGILLKNRGNPSG